MTRRLQRGPWASFLPDELRATVSEPGRAGGRREDAREEAWGPLPGEVAGAARDPWGGECLCGCLSPRPGSGVYMVPKAAPHCIPHNPPCLRLTALPGHLATWALHRAFRFPVSLSQAGLG